MSTPTITATDNQIVYALAGNDRQFAVLCRIMQQEWATDPLFSTNSARVANRKRLIAEMSQILQHKTTDEWLAILRGQGLPFAPINNIQKTFEHPQAIARKVVVEVEHPRAGKIKLAAPAIVYDGNKMDITRPPPVLGQHTLEVLRESLGLRDEQLADLHDKGVI